MSDTALDELTDLYENAPCGYVSILPDGKIGRINRTLADWLGRPADELIAKRFTDILGFGGRIAYETHLSPLLRLHGKVEEIALDLLDASGQKIPAIANGTARKDENGNFLLSRLAIVRATDRRTYERTILAGRDKAVISLQEQQDVAILREQFIAVLGHDLRNPLAALASGVYLLGRETLSDKGRALVNMMGESAARATLLTENVLDFARGRLGEGLILARDAREPLTPVLEQVVNEVRAISPGKIIEATFEIDEPVDCDRQRLGQIAANLLSNAVTHGAPEIPIRVDARTVDGNFVFSVSNGGAAIPPEQREALFQPFFRGATRQSQQGLGLGLFIVSEIAKAHGGEMDVQSNEERTMFRFTMPLKSVSAA